MAYKPYINDDGTLVELPLYADMALKDGNGNEITTTYGRVSFDVVIKTQEQFEELIASPTWLDANSVAFVGDGGTLKFTHSDLGLVIPSNVKQIVGFNNAIIYNSHMTSGWTSFTPEIGYATLPTDEDYFIRDISVYICGTGILISGENGIGNMRNVINCHVHYIDGTYGTGFVGCDHLINCRVTGNFASTTNYGKGYEKCYHLINCFTNFKVKNTDAWGFDTCKYLVGCYAYLSRDEEKTSGLTQSYGYKSCYHLVNCRNELCLFDKKWGFYSCNVLSNCNCYASGDGVYSGDKIGYGYYSCNYCSSCRSESSQITAIWGGTNNKRCDDSCQV